jgi:hypothetical protein
MQVKNKKNLWENEVHFDLKQQISLIAGICLGVNLTDNNFSSVKICCFTDLFPALCEMT